MENLKKKKIASRFSTEEYFRQNFNRAIITPHHVILNVGVVERRTLNPNLIPDINAISRLSQGMADHGKRVEGEGDAWKVMAKYNSAAPRQDNRGHFNLQTSKYITPPLSFLSVSLAP